MKRFSALVAAVLCGAAFAQSNNQFSPDYKPLEAGSYVDTRPEWQEGELKLPAYPNSEKLVGFEVSALNSFRFFIDPESISAGADGIVRYTLVARSSSGVENVSFNGLRCKTGEHKMYASGRTVDQAWSVARDSRWKIVEAKTVTRQHLVLMRDFFCPAAIPIASRGEGIDALKRGFHPQAVSNPPNYIRPQ